MNANESRKLKIGDKVGYVDKTVSETLPIDYGIVLANNKHAVQIRWEDVESSGCEDGIGWINHDDADVLQREN